MIMTKEGIQHQQQNSNQLYQSVHSLPTNMTGNNNSNDDNDDNNINRESNRESG